MYIDHKNFLNIKYKIHVLYFIYFIGIIYLSFKKTMGVASLYIPNVNTSLFSVITIYASMILLLFVATKLF